MIHWCRGSYPLRSNEEIVGVTGTSVAASEGSPDSYWGGYWRWAIWVGLQIWGRDSKTKK